MKNRWLCLLLALLLTASMPAAALAQERGYETPEACAQALFDALQTQDVALMESCMAFEEMAAGFDYQAQAERMKSAPTFVFQLPATDAFTEIYNVETMRRNWYMRVSSLILYAADPALAALLFDGKTYSVSSEEYTTILASVDSLDTDNVLADYEYQGTIAPSEISAAADAYAKQEMQERLQSTMACWGIDTFTELAMVVQKTGGSLFNGKITYILPVRFVQVDGRWLIDPNGSMLGSILGLRSTDLVMEMP